MKPGSFPLSISHPRAAPTARPTAQPRPPPRLFAHICKAPHGLTPTEGEAGHLEGEEGREDLGGDGDAEGLGHGEARHRLVEPHHAAHQHPKPQVQGA